MDTKKGTDRTAWEYGAYPYGYQVYDEIHLRSGWEEAFEKLRQDIESGARNIHPRIVRQQLDLAPNWSWDELHNAIKNDPVPENAFNNLLKALYRSETE